MKIILQIEQIGLLLLSIFLFSQYVNYTWWWYLLFFFTPDISMLGYMGGNKIGATIYNLFHHQGVAVILIVSGIAYRNQAFLFSGLILLGHSAFDRVMGYGLKLNEGFGFTHLGRIGKNK